MKDAILENTLTKEVKNEFNKFKELEKMVHRENLVYITNEYTYSFENFRKISTFGRDIYNGKITLKEANKDQSDLLVEILNFRKQVKPRCLEKNNRKKMFLKTYIVFLKLEKEFLTFLKAKYFQ